MDLVDTPVPGVLVAFLPTETVDATILFNSIRAAIREASPSRPVDPEVVLLLRPSYYQDGLAELVQALQDDFGTNLVVTAVTVGSDRALAIPPGVPASVLDGKKLEEYGEQVFSAGLKHLFATSGTVMRALPGYHFEAPGGKHLRVFVRTGNMFASSTTTSFVAQALLNVIDLSDVRTVLTDTSSINALGYELARLRGLHFDSSEVTVHSEGGYEFIDDPASVFGHVLFLVSVSFSGAYAERMQEKYKEAQVHSIIGISDQLASDRFLLRPFDDSSLDPIDKAAEEAGACSRCKAGNETVVRIEGDQLIPSAPSVTSRMITRPDAQRWLGGVRWMEAVEKLDTVKVFHERSQVDADRRTSHRTLYLDFQDFIATLDPSAASASGRKGARGRPAREDTPLGNVESLGQELLDKLRKSLAELNPTHLLVPNDPTSRALGTLAGSLAAAPLKIISWADGLEELESAESPRVLVLCGVAASGRTLLQISKRLRFLASKPRAAVDYFVFVARSSDSNYWQYTAQNIQTGSGVAQKSRLTTVMQMWLPDDRIFSDSVWKQELDFWLEQILPSLEALPPRGIDGAAARAQIEERVATLRSGDLRNNLLITSAQDMNVESEALTLGGNFAWWTFPYERGDVSQAVLYLNFAAVVDYSRGPHVPEAEAALTDGRFFDRSQTLYNLTTIHPLNFDRYDDAVTQATLIRASFDRELDYSTSNGLSAAMLNVIVRVVDEFVLARSDASALGEFLLALSSKRMRLHPKHLAYFADYLPEDLPPVLGVLASKLRAL